MNDNNYRNQKMSIELKINQKGNINVYQQKSIRYRQICYGNL